MNNIIFPLAVKLHKYRKESTWLAARGEHITASDMARWMCPNNEMSRFRLWQEKTGALKPEEPSEELRRAWDWGHDLEPMLAKYWQRDVGQGQAIKAVDIGRFTIVTNDEVPYLSCTLDRAVIDTGCSYNGGYEFLAPLECKTRPVFSKKEWQENGVPQDVVVQCHVQMLITGADRCYVAVSFAGSGPLYTTLERDNALCADIQIQSKLFADSISTATPPPIDGSDASRQAISRLHPSDNGETVPLPYEFLDLDNEREDLLIQKKVVDARIAEIDNKIRLELGDNTFGTLPDGIRYSLKTVHKNEYIVKPQTYRQLRRSDAYA